MTPYGLEQYEIGIQKQVNIKCKKLQLIVFK